MDTELTATRFPNMYGITYAHVFLNRNSDLFRLGKLHDKTAKENKLKEAEEDSLIYYSSVNENTDDNLQAENEIDYHKLEDKSTIFKQIQNYTKNVLIK